MPETYTIVSWIKIESILIKPQCVLTLSVTDVLPTFSIIQFIYLSLKKPFFVVQLLETLGFCRHLYAYRVSHTNNWKSVQCQSIYYSITSVIKCIDGDYVIM